MNHEAEDAPLIPEVYPTQPQPQEIEEQPKTETINKILLKNAAQAFSPAYMLTKQIFVFSGAIRKSMEQYRQSQRISFFKNFAKSIEEYDGISYSKSLDQDNSLTSKSIKYVGEKLSKINKTPPLIQQTTNIRNESLIAEQSQRNDEEQQIQV